jgi:hypothetical protein
MAITAFYNSMVNLDNFSEEFIGLLTSPGRVPRSLIHLIPLKKHGQQISAFDDKIYLPYEKYM